mmetsp:Transcript_35393/g.34433  ORF Transcript_35393/g.34433 Transcript_35393/m.34433 type:complete len:87 (+) Transcript_35393:141-401(+)
MCGEIINLYQGCVLKANNINISMFQSEVLNEILTCGDLDVLKRININFAKLNNAKELLKQQEKFKEKEVSLCPIVSVQNDDKQAQA